MIPQEIFYTCPKCRSCVTTDGPDFYPSCPSYEEFKLFTYSAGGKFKIARGLSDGRLCLDDDIADAIYKCTLCGSCKRCTIVKNPFEYFAKIREEYVREQGVFSKHRTLIDSLINYKNPWMQPKTERDRWAKRLNAKKISDEGLLFYVGCTSSYDPVFKKMAESTTKILQRAGIPFGILGRDEVCCGSTALRIGHKELFLEFARENIERFNSLGVKTIVTACAGCYKTISQDYAGVGKVEPEVLHTVQYIDRLIKDGAISLSEGKYDVVTYHDPCHLGRHCGVFDPPRDVINSAGGVKLVEMKRIRDDSFCCGAGGGVRMAYPEFASNTARRRHEDAQETGAGTLISACPFCEQNLKENFPEIDVIDITKFVEMSMG